MTALAHAALDTSRPFTRAQALAAGIRPSALRTCQYRRLFPGVYVAGDVPLTAWLRAAAALACFPDRACATHASAARITGVPIPTIPDEHVTVVEQRNRRRRAGIVCHHAQRTQFRWVDGIRVSSHAQMFVELATLLSLVDLVVVGDHLVRRTSTTRAGLTAFCSGQTGNGVANARRAAAFVRPRVDSPMETRLRMLLVLAGLPEPAVNVPLRLDDGTVVRRYDLSYPEAKIAIEYDGRHHIQREEQWESDLARREAGDEDGWRTLVVTSHGLFSEPERTLARVHSLARRRRVPGVPARLCDDWRPHFPSR
jgi:hypothetical protein